MVTWPAPTMENTSAPLADYFWIAGVDNLSYNDPIPNQISSRDQFGTTPSPQVETTIEEGSEGENFTPIATTRRATAQHSRQNSWQRLNKLPHEARGSISNIEELDVTRSNRSSITIKAGNAGNTNDNGNGNSLGDFDFDTALMKFANERENFLDDLSFRAGLPVQKPAPMTNPAPNIRTDRLKAEDAENGSGRRSPLRSVGGSIRRKISFRDMNSMKRQPSTVQRASKWDIQLRARDCLQNRLET